jgi:hypothetical protein
MCSASAGAAWPNTGLDECGIAHNKTIPAKIEPIKPFRFMGFLLEEFRERATQNNNCLFWFSGCAEYTAVCSRQKYAVEICR